MNPVTKPIHLTLATLMLAIFTITLASAGDVDVSFSSREAYVGMPIVMQIEISNATGYSQPELPEMDGVDIQPAGAPSRSSQITIINGRRSEKQSVTLRYKLTPRRAGTFELPAISLQVDGKTVQTKPARFVATKSETGDLLFVELEGKADQVYVGEPLDMTLKVYIKPYRDRQRGITLSEADMWRMISEDSLWGGFTKALQAMAENNQRPAGREVLRNDGEGNQRSYYLYEIDAKIYPTRAGQIDAEDVQIVINYPTALGKSRDPLASFFEDSPFGANSPFSRMMDDDFFSSPFRNRLSVTSARPVVGEVQVDATEVLPVPTKDRPADYRGAVGEYKIFAEASPLNVKAGDAIKLNIGIIGTGPMELVQAPPLALQPSLKDFKVSGEPLAGFVQDDTKLFSTSIRPRREGISEIPPISFSFFNPKTKSFATVQSDPIAITVGKAESLALDAIVARRAERDPQSAATPTTLQPSFVNHETLDVLRESGKSQFASRWWFFAVLPFCVWLVTLVWTRRSSIANLTPNFRSPCARCLTQIEQASSANEILSALNTYVASVCRSNAVNSTTSTAGKLRLAGHYQCAAEFESLEAKANRNADHTNGDLADIRNSATQLVKDFKTAHSDSTRTFIRRSGFGRDQRVLQPARHVARVSVILFACLTGISSPATAEDRNSQDALTRLTSEQQTTLFTEANDVYRVASELQTSDAIGAKEKFLIAASKYELLVESGIANGRLFFNLANAHFQAGNLGLAIVNYERALRLDPADQQTKVNLELAKSMVVNTSATNAASKNWLQNANTKLSEFAGPSAMRITLVIASVVFWGLLTVKLLGAKFRTWRWATVPLAVTLLALASVVTSATASNSAGDALLVTDEAVLRIGDGEQFEQVATIKSAQGHRVNLLTQRGNWSQIQTATNDVGWVSSDSVEQI